MSEGTKEIALLKRLSEMARQMSNGASAVRVFVWADGTLTLEQYSTFPEELDSWGMRRQRLRSTYQSYAIDDLSKAIDALSNAEVTIVHTQAPQQAWFEKRSLRRRLKKAEDLLSDLLKIVRRGGKLTMEETVDIKNTLSALKSET